MSAFGLSKADREIAAQGTDLNEAAVEKKRSGKSVAGRSGRVPGNFSNEFDLASNESYSECLMSAPRTISSDKRSTERKDRDEDECCEKISGQAAFSRPSDRYGEYRYSPNDEDAGAGWDRPAVTASRNGSKTLLQWNLFD